MPDDLWEARRDALEALDSTLARQKAGMDHAFEYLDMGIEKLRQAQQQEDEHGRLLATCSLVLAAKGRLLALGIYSLSLDSIGQEAGALLRPLLEVIEHLAFIRMERSHLDEFAEGRLRKSGLVAKAAGSDFQPLRNLLSESASHWSLSAYAVRHLFGIDEKGSPSLRTTQPYSEKSLRGNLASLLSFMTALNAQILNNAMEAGVDIDEATLEQINFFSEWGPRIMLVTEE